MVGGDAANIVGVSVAGIELGGDLTAEGVATVHGEPIDHPPEQFRVVSRHVGGEIACRPLGGVADAQSRVDVVVAHRISVSPAVISSTSFRLHGVDVIRRCTRIRSRTGRAVSARGPESEDSHTV